MNRASAVLGALSRADVAPNLVLFVGAFLVIASGAAFAQLASVPLVTKLVLLAVATVALGAGGHALRASRALALASSAFMFTAALLVPIDLAVLAYTLFDIPKIAVDLLWAAGSLAAAALYAALATAGYGRVFSYLCFLFTLHAVARFIGYFDARPEWYLAAGALVALSIEAPTAALRCTWSQRVLGPLVLPARVLAAASGLLAALGHVIWIQEPAEDLAVGPQALFWLAVALTLYHALRSRLGDGIDRELAAAGPLVVYYAVVRAVTAPTLELVAAPLGLYLVLAAVCAERALRVTLESRDKDNLAALGAVLLLAPLVVSDLDLATTARALVESLTVLVGAAALGRARVALVGALSLGILAIRLVAGSLGAYAPWAVFGAAGLLLLLLGVMLLRRSAVAPWADRASADD